MLKFTEYYKDRPNLEIFEECFNRFYEKHLSELDRDTIENYLKTMFYNIQDSINDSSYDSIHYLIDILKRTSVESIFYKEIFFKLTNIDLKRMNKETIERTIFTFGLEKIKNGTGNE